MFFFLRFFFLEIHFKKFFLLKWTSKIEYALYIHLYMYVCVCIHACVGTLSVQTHRHTKWLTFLVFLESNLIVSLENLDYFRLDYILP